MSGSRQVRHLNPSELVVVMVAALANPNFLVELEAIAVVPE